MKPPGHILNRKGLFDRTGFFSLSFNLNFHIDSQKDYAPKGAFLKAYFNRALAGKATACSYLKETNLKDYKNEN